MDFYEAVTQSHGTSPGYRAVRCRDGSVARSTMSVLNSSEDNNRVFGRSQSFVAGPSTNVQFMVKDATKYATTGGWGFGICATRTRIGVLTGFDLRPNLLPLSRLNATIVGIQTGSREYFEDMNRFIEELRITPAVDRGFAFDEALHGFAHMAEQRHWRNVPLTLRLAAALRHHRHLKGSLVLCEDDGSPLT